MPAPHLPTYSTVVSQRLQVVTSRSFQDACISTPATSDVVSPTGAGWQPANGSPGRGGTLILDILFTGLIRVVVEAATAGLQRHRWLQCTI